MNSQINLMESTVFGIEKTLEEISKINAIDEEVDRSFLSIMAEMQAALSALERVLDSTDYYL